MEKRAKTSKKISSRTSQFLKSNPQIAKALDLFQMSIEQYRIATEATHISTEASTNLSGYEFYRDAIKKTR